MLTALSAKHISNIKVKIGNGVIIADDVQDATQVHQMWSWAMSLLQTNPRTTLVIVEGIFKSITGGMVRIDRDAGIYLSWHAKATEIGTEGWPDGRVRLLRFYKEVPCSLFISIRELDAEPEHIEYVPPQPEVLDFNNL